MLLNFKKAPEETSLVTIHDGYGCSIDIPSKGYVDATEYPEAMKLIINASEDNRLHTVERDIVVMLLISRFKLPLNTSPEKLLRLEDGSMIGAPMLKALYNHFVTELGADADVIKFPLGNYPNFTQSEIVNV
ncbi:MAG: hypothetical protein ACKPFF_23375, partial [Planktothrix sp.]